MSTVSENIRYLRKLKGYTQEQFAERIGIKRSLLGAYEEARANPNEIYLDSMAALLGVEVEHLLHEDLKERGRKLGAGTILKLNPAMPHAGPEPSIENLAPEKKPDEEEKKNSQMDLFEGPAKSSAGQSHPINYGSMPSYPHDSKIAKEKETGIDESFLSMLAGLISSQKGYRVFTQPEDVPLTGLEVIGRQLERVDLVESNRLYIIVTTDHQVLFRRAFNQIAIKGTLILSSDFSGKPTIELPVSAIKEVFQYVATIQTGDPSPAAPVQKLKALTEEMIRLLNS